jgi:hypothetical protein
MLAAPKDKASKTYLKSFLSLIKALLDGKRGITLGLVEDLEKEGYTFVYKDDLVWKETPRGKVMTRVRTSLTDYRRTRAKRKAVHMSTSDVYREETTCADARNVEKFQP